MYSHIRVGVPECWMAAVAAAAPAEAAVGPNLVAAVRVRVEAYLWVRAAMATVEARSGGSRNPSSLHHTGTDQTRSPHHHHHSLHLTPSCTDLYTGLGRLEGTVGGKGCG